MPDTRFATPQPITKQFPVGTRKLLSLDDVRRKAMNVPDGKDVYGITINTNTPDRSKDRVMPSGALMADYMAGGAGVYLNHDTSSGMFGGSFNGGLPIGQTHNLAVIANQDGTEALDADFSFADDDPIASRVKNLWDQRILNCASIGFIPLKEVPNNIGGWDTNTWDMLEWSVVSIPANPAAVRRSLDLLGLLGLDTDTVEQARARAHHLVKAGRAVSNKSEGILRSAIAQINEATAQIESLLSDLLKDEADERDELATFGDDSAKSVSDATLTQTVVVSLADDILALEALNRVLRGA